MIMACVADAMLRRSKNMPQEQGIAAYRISLEERMACGVGPVWGAYAGTKEIDSHSHVHNDRILYGRTCILSGRSGRYDQKIKPDRRS